MFSIKQFYFELKPLSKNLIRLNVIVKQKLELTLGACTMDP